MFDVKVLHYMVDWSHTRLYYHVFLGKENESELYIPKFASASLVHVTVTQSRCLIIYLSEPLSHFTVLTFTGTGGGGG